MPQVEEGHYRTQEYESKRRFISYWHQLNEAKSIGPRSILEIGIGNGFFSSMARTEGFDVVTLDIDKKLRPDVVGSVLNMPFLKEIFDLVACFEVLEHLPYHLFPCALREINRITRKDAILSLPDATPYFQVQMTSSFLNMNPISIPFTGFKKVHHFDGEHYWEIGKKGYALKSVIGVIRDNGFEIIKTYRVPENPYHRFFTLRK